MDREEIINAVEQPDFTGEPPQLYKLLTRRYKEYRANESQLNGIGASRRHLGTLEEENRKLDAAVKDKEASAARSRAAAEQVRKEIQEGEDRVTEEIRKLDGQIAELDKESLSLQRRIEELQGKSSEVERLRRKLADCRDEEDNLQAEIDRFSEEEKNNQELVRRLEPFVVELEECEKTMAELVSSIWGDLKKDSFDNVLRPHNGR